MRWIGRPGSDQPAPVTRVETGAPVQNAGGEGAAKRAGGHDTFAITLGAGGLLWASPRSP